MTAMGDLDEVFPRETERIRGRRSEKNHEGHEIEVASPSGI